jgi:hypothetical protein
MPILEKLITRSVILVGRVFWCFFLERSGDFAEGFSKKRVAQDSFLMVNLWWNAVPCCHVDGRFSGSKIMQPIFGVISVLGMVGRRG